MNPKVAIAISGGIDSLVAAHLLKARHPDLIGIHFSTGYGNMSPDQIAGVAHQLEIPLKIIDVGDLFGRAVVEYFTGAYERGTTPNPCLVCNPVIKFGAVMTVARKMGAAFLATGHYARVVRDQDGQCRLLKGIDAAKDQSYFLAFLRQAQLARAVFPLGGMTKATVRLIAAEQGLVPAADRESRDICFIKASYETFLVEKGGVVPRPGPISDLSGRVIGTHAGLHRFTVGQRRGINCPARKPYYVIEIDPRENRLVVGFKADLPVARCRLSGVRWIGSPPAGPVRLAVRIRYRHRAVAATFEPGEGNSGTLEFASAEPAVTPGQGAVFYQDEEVLGGGWIEKYR